MYVKHIKLMCLTHIEFVVILKIESQFKFISEKESIIRPKGREIDEI